MVLDNIIKDGFAVLSKRHNISYRIDNVILGKSVYTMKNCESVFNDMNICLLILEQGYGFAYFQEKLDFRIAEMFVNKDIREILESYIPLYFKVAIADGIYSILNNLNHQYRLKKFNGDLRTKAFLRAKELVRGIPKGSKVLLLGAVTEIIDECNKKKLELSILDLEPSKIGLTFGSKTVENSKKLFKEKVNSTEYVISTGMIFVTDTVDMILEGAIKQKFKLILYMETGSNFGGKLIEYGAYKVLSELFPYYDFSGETRYIIFKK